MKHWILKLVSFKKEPIKKTAALPEWLPTNVYDFEPTEEQARELIYILNHRQASVREALTILDALYMTEYMPTESGNGNHELYLQNLGYRMTEEDLDAMDEIELSNLISNIFYNSTPIKALAEPVIEQLIERALTEVNPEFIEGYAQKAPAGWEKYRKMLSSEEGEVSEIEEMMSNNDISGLINYLKTFTDEESKAKVKEYLLDNA